MIILCGLTLAIEAPSVSYAATQNEFFNESDIQFYDPRDTGLYECNSNTSISANISESTTEEPPNDYAKVQVSGQTLNKRTQVMLETAEKLYGKDFSLSQGSYEKANGVSGDTHLGGGALDVQGLNSMSQDDITKAVKSLRQAGFAAWERVPQEGFAHHIHAEAIGDKDLSPGAASQVKAYFAGKSGLDDNKEDRHLSTIGRPIPTWAKKFDTSKDSNSNSNSNSDSDTSTNTNASSSTSSGATCCPANSIDLGDTSDHVMTAFRFFMSKGLKDYMAAGIIGNLQQESTATLRSDILQGGGKGTTPTPGQGFGIAQWTPKSRQDELVKFAKTKGKPVTDFVTQLDFIYYEMTDAPYDDYKSALPALQATQNEVDAAVSFHQKFEKSADSAASVRQVRGKNATRELQKFRANPGNDSISNVAASVTASGSTDSSSGGCGSGSDSGDFGAKIDGKCTQQKVKVEGEEGDEILKPDVRLIVQCVDGYFPGFVTPTTYPGHQSGYAVDLMVPNYKTQASIQKGWALAKWLQAHQKELGVHYLIWQIKIWNVERDSDGWRPYDYMKAMKCAADNCKHLNHIHTQGWGDRATGMDDVTQKDL